MQHLPKLVQLTCLTITVVLMSLASYGQYRPYIERDSLANNYKKPKGFKKLHREGGYQFCRTEKSIGIVPEIQGTKHLFFGLGLSRANFTHGEGGGNGFGTTLAIECNPINKVIAPKLNVWATGYVLIFGGNIGLNCIYYIQNGQRNFVLRPEIGLGLIKVYLNYGYNLFLKDNSAGINKHTLTLSYYHTFYPWKD